MFLCQPTGGGKSAVRDAFASGEAGITLSIAPLLALNADQASKLNSRKVTSGTVVIHYDQYKRADDIAAIEDSIIRNASSLSVVIFCSPQMLTDRAASIVFIDRLLHSNLLRLVCVDEAHLFCEFGLYFRKEFLALKPVLFSKLLLGQPSNQSYGNHTICPVLVMTASATKSLLHQFESITGLRFDPPDIFWPDALGMQCRRQTIRFQPHAQPIRLFKPMIDALTINHQKFIYYSNRCVNVERARDGITAYLDAHNLSGDIVAIVGPYSKEQKFHRTELFLNPASLPASSLQDFNPVGCSVTRSLGAAGWDSDSIHLVFSSDMPTNILCVLQEKGRAGRRPGADGSEDSYWVCFDLDDYLYLVTRAYKGQSGTGIDMNDFTSLRITLVEYTNQQLDEFLEVLEFFVLPHDCQHCILERRLSNPFTDPTSFTLTPCGIRCQYCLDGGAVHASFKPMVRSGVEAVLFDLFFGENRLLEPTFDGDEILITAICNYPDCQKLVFASNANAKPSKAVVKRLLMLLLAVKMIRIRHIVQCLPDDTSDDQANATKQIHKLVAWIPLSPPPDRSPLFTDNAMWDRLPTTNPL